MATSPPPIKKSGGISPAGPPPQHPTPPPAAPSDAAASARPNVATPQEKGRQHEIIYSKRWGLKLVPGSGATPRAMLDTGLGKLIISLKHTIHGSIRITGDMLREARAGAYGPRAKSTDMIPALSFHLEEDGEDWTALPTDVLMEILRGEIEVEAPAMSRFAELRARAG